MTDQPEVSRRRLLRSSLVLAGSTSLGIGVANAVRAAVRQPQLTIAMPSNPETIDQHRFRSIMSGSIIACAVETLLTRDPVTMEIKPCLATGYRNVDPNTWEFSLRQGVRFHNGEPFNADSVKFSIERFVDTPLNMQAKTVWPPSFGQSVQIVDPYTVRIVTKVPDPLVPNRLAAEGLNMAPPKAMAEFRDKFSSNTLIGTGPYRFVEYTVGRQVVFEANPDYWGEKPATQRIVWQIIPDPATRLAALQRATVDIIVNLPVPSIPTVKSDGNLQLYSVLGSVLHCLLLNTYQTAALKDQRVRRALNHAIDRDSIIKNLYMGLGQTANGVVARQVEYAINPSSYAYDPDLARKLLSDAGYADSLNLTLWQSTGRYELGVEAAQAIVGYFDDVGVQTNLQVLEWGEYNSRAGGSQFKDAFHYGFINGIWDPQYLLQRFVPSYPVFRYYEASGELEQNLLRYAGVFPKEERAKLAATCQQQVHDAAPWVFLWQLNENFGLRRGVQGFKMRPDHMLIVRDAYIDT